MRARSRYLGSLAFAALLLLAACGGESDSSAPAEEAPAPLTGVISSIDPPEGAPESFDLTRPGEDPQRILIDPEVDYGMDLQHLHEHLNGVLPVKVSLDQRVDGLYATAIEDV